MKRAVLLIAMLGAGLASGAVVFKGVQVHNVAELVREKDGRMSLRRIPARAEAAMGEQGRRMNAGNTGVELRFVMKGDEVRLRLGGATDASFSRLTVYHGDIIGDWPELYKNVAGRNAEIVIRKPKNLAELRAVSARQHGRFDAAVVRLVVPSGDLCIIDVVGEVEPPPSEMVPRKTYLAYGSSITHGSNALAIEECFASRVGRGLGADVRNLGFAGSARMEPEVADCIADCPFDLATLEMGINILGTDPAEFERRVRYFVRRIGESHPQARIFVIDVFGNRCGERAQAQAVVFRSVVRRVVDELKLPNVAYVSGLDLLPDDTEIAAGGTHPTPRGHELIARELLKRFELAEGQVRQVGL